MYDIMKRDIDRFGTSDYAIANEYSISIANKKASDLMKNENNSTIMVEFVGLRAKLYALRTMARKIRRRSKNIKNNIVAKMTFHDYTRCLREEIDIKRQ